MLALRWLAVGAAAALVTIAVGRTEFFGTVEAKAYDWRVRHALDDGGETRAALVLVDEATLAFFKEEEQLRWPFPRDLYCPVLRYLAKGGAAAVAFDLHFSEPQEFDPVFAECLGEVGRVYLGYQCQGGEAEGLPWPVAAAAPDAGLTPCRPLLPMEELRKAAKGGGRIDMEADADGVLRWVTPLWPVAGGGAPALGLAPLIDEVGRDAVRLEGDELVVGERRLPLDDKGRALVGWRPQEQPYPTYSFAKIFANAVLLEEGGQAALDPAVFKDKVVFLGASAAGTFETRVTPVREKDYGIHLHAAVFDAIDRDAPMRRSAAWIDGLVTLLAALAMAGVLILPLPWVRFWPRGVMAAAAAGGFFWLNVTLFGEARLWLGLVEPLAAMAVAFAGGTVWNYLAEGRERRAIRFAFQHYLAPAVVDELVRDPSKLRLGGERREITCFFSDIAGFTTISESMEPATLVTLMNEVLGEMTELILAEGGTIDKYIGDAIVGIFGAPLDQPDHAERACVAALRCQQRLEQLRAKWRAEGLPALEVRIGLNSGVALVGNMGAAQRFDYTMLGDVVNLGARLEGTNKVYGTPTLVGAETRQLAGEAILMRPLDSVRVKGKRLPVEVYEPLALAAEASDDERALAERFERALAAYRGQRWEEARAALASVREVRPEDGPARVLAERIARFEAEPPGAQWDGVFEMTTK